MRQAPSEQRPWTESPPSTPSGSGEWTAFQNPEATCRDLTCSPKQCPTPGTPPWGSLLWTLGGGAPAQFTPLETGPSSALRTAVSPSRLVLCALGCGGSCPRQLRETLTSPGSSPGTQLEDGEHSSWRRRGEERVQPGVGKTWAVSVPIVLPSGGGPLRMLGRYGITLLPLKKLCYLSCDCLLSPSRFLAPLNAVLHPPPLSERAL